MNFYNECLQIAEDNKKDPHPDFWFMTRCLKNWNTRKKIYLNMKSQTLNEEERYEFGLNLWGEDVTMEKLIKKGRPVQHILALVLEARNLELDMLHRKTFDNTHLVIPLLNKLTELFYPIWQEEVIKLKIKKDHPEIRTILHFAFNLREYSNKDVIDFTINLLKNF